MQELEQELSRQEPRGLPISKTTLAIATAQIHSRIRSRGLSDGEMLTQRDQLTSNQLSFSDQELIGQQHEHRLLMYNHYHSEKTKVPLVKVGKTPLLVVGDIVYLYTDHNKARSRDRHLVTAKDNSS